VQLERLEQVQHLQHREALGRRRRLVDRDVAIGALDRLGPARGLRLEVGLGEEAVVGLAPAHQLLADVAPVEAMPAVTGDRFERASEVGVPEHRAVLQQDRRRLRALLQVGCRKPPPVRQPLGHREAVARIADRALQAAGERQAAVGGMRLGPARHRAGHGEGAGQHALVRHLAETALGEGGDRAARGRAAAAVDVADSAGLGVVDQPERIAADRRHVRIEHRQHGAGGERGIDRRAAGAQHVDAGRGGERMGRGHQAVRRQRGRTACQYFCHEKLLDRVAGRLTGKRELLIS